MKVNPELTDPLAVKPSSPEKVISTVEEEPEEEVRIVALTVPSASAISLTSVMYSSFATASRDTVCQIPEQG